MPRIRNTRPLASSAIIAVLLLCQGCFVTTDENLWKQRDAAPDVATGDAVGDAPLSDGPRAERGPDGPATDMDGPALDGPATEGLLVDLPGTETGKLPLGATCGVGAECDSDKCADGVCCKTACKKTCKACNISGKKGTCSHVSDGLDPRGDCTQTAATTCGDDGTCDGSGVCRKWPSGTVCGTNSCIGLDKVQQKACNGTGACISSLLTCAPFRCDKFALQCFAACTSSAQCYIYKCDTSASTCYSKCSSATQCQTGYKCAGSKCK